MFAAHAMPCACDYYFFPSLAQDGGKTTFLELFGDWITCTICISNRDPFSGFGTEEIHFCFYSCL